MQELMRQLDLAEVIKAAVSSKELKPPTIPELIQMALKKNRAVAIWGGEVLDVSGARNLGGNAKRALASLESQSDGYDVRALAADADQSATDLVANPATEMVGVLIEGKDAPDSADLRAHTVQLAWNDGAAQTSNILVNPDRHNYKLLVILARLNNQIPAIRVTTSAGVTATIAQGGTRTGFSLQATGVIARDIKRVRL